MSKKQSLEEGQLYVVPLPDGSYTIAHLINHHIVSSRTSQNTFAFFNYKFLSLEEITKSVDELDIATPFAIATSNSKPKSYDWKLIANKDIAVKFDYKSKIGSLGLYDNSSTDPSIFLEPYFGLFPWDGYFKDDYLDEFMLPNAKMRDDVKYLKDFTTDELKELLPPNSPKLIQRLKEEE